jgi:hypothetical protein
MSPEVLEKLGRFERSEIIMAKDLKVRSFESLLGQLRQAGAHALLVKYRRGDEDIVLVDGNFFEALASKLREYQARIEELEDELEEREIAAVLAGRVVEDGVEWRSASEFEAALRAHRPGAEARR